jgi:hypothetical protein
MYSKNTSLKTVEKNFSYQTVMIKSSKNLKCANYKYL